TLRGQVTDDSGAVIPAAQVTITNSTGVVRSVATGADGTFVAAGLKPGQYTVRVTFQGFAPYENKAVDVSGGRTRPLTIKLKLAAGKQEVTVTGEPGATVSTEPDNNAGALVLRGTELEALPDDPDDLSADLQALAGPAAGPS